MAVAILASKPVVLTEGVTRGNLLTAMPAYANITVSEIEQFFCIGRYGLGLTGQCGQGFRLSNHKQVQVSTHGSLFVEVLHMMPNQYLVSAVVCRRNSFNASKSLSDWRR